MLHQSSLDSRALGRPVPQARTRPPQNAGIELVAAKPTTETEQVVQLWPIPCSEAPAGHEDGGYDWRHAATRR